MTKLSDLRVGQIWEDAVGSRREIISVERYRVKTKLLYWTDNIYEWAYESVQSQLLKLCYKLISEPNVFEQLKVGQIWESEQGIRREILTLGPDYVGVRELHNGGPPIYTYHKDNKNLPVLFHKQIIPKKKKYWINIYKSYNPESFQAGQLYATKKECDELESAKKRIDCVEVEISCST